MRSLFSYDWLFATAGFRVDDNVFSIFINVLAYVYQLEAIEF